MKKFFFLHISSLFLVALMHAQTIGEWRMHINYANSIDIAVGKNRILSANDKSVLFYDLDDNSIQTLDKVKGLSDYGINAVAYDDSTDYFIIAYQNSNLDLIKDNTIINLPDIKNKISAGSKNINNLYTHNGLCYVSTDFGIVVIDILNEEIDNTYIIGATGDPVIVYDCTIVEDTLYAATAEGTKRIWAQSNNLLDFSEWEHLIPSLPNFIEVETYNDTLYGITEGLYAFSHGQLTELFIDTFPLKSLTASDSLTLVQSRKVLVKRGWTVDTVPTTYMIDPSIMVFVNGRAYSGDYKIGLCDGSNYIRTSSFPFTNNGFDACSFGNTVVITSGAIDKGLNPKRNVEGGFYIYKDNYWQNLNIYTGIPANPPTQDISRVKYGPDGHLYFGSSLGMLEYDFNTFIVYNEDNSPIQTASGNPDFQIVSGLDFDSKGNLWIINPLSNHALLLKNTDGSWSSFVSGNDNDKINNLLIDAYDQKWLPIAGDGIRVFKEGANYTQSGSQYVDLTTNPNSGNLPNNTVNCMTEDKDGKIWVGTDEGIAVFSCPGDILDPSTGCRVSDRITSTLDQYTEYLFETDIVSAIEVDGANRKWIGTSAGVYLMSADGKDQLLAFNPDNSPLPSTEINDITINKNTGEVFILTSKGIVSYIGDATEGASDYSEIKAYPNPVRPDYTGVISISGLTENAFVKITDERGFLAFEGYALGGKFTWDGKDYNGKKVNTGVYYIFSQSNDGTKKGSTKLAFVK